MAVLDPLDEAALDGHFTKAKECSDQTVSETFSYENVDLTFEEEALRAIAQEAIKRNTGARGLRGVIESAMLDIMYEMPSQSDVKECIITEQVITSGDKPELVYGRKTRQKVPRTRQKAHN